uniref:Uncharacterized protein n=1 Tax=Rhizophora mucronata TaxID=61149 RepID=A0A2P2PJY5_RHIMU
MKPKATHKRLLRQISSYIWVGQSLRSIHFCMLEI